LAAVHIGLSVRNCLIIHDLILRSQRAFRRRENASTGQWNFASDSPARTGFSSLGCCHRPSTNRRRCPAGRGRERTPVESSSAGRNFGFVEAGSHLSNRLIITQNGTSLRCCRRFSNSTIGIWCELRSTGPSPERGTATTENGGPVRISALN
jgi:hypothetical protein